ncbi:hypothetical protein ACJJIU_11545 [Microbulbifer sp. CnH-101-E]|uniref:hypothetical protein n=1 Tax=unclassified Microbulbifer TaxID=2619833 RepID=UPI00403A1EC4
MQGEIITATPRHADIVAHLVAKLLMALVGHKREIKPDQLIEASNKLLVRESDLAPF